MNVATRVLQNSVIRIRTPELVQNFHWSAGMIVLAIAILLSAFGVIYLKDLNRRLFIQYQIQDQARTQYEVEWGKLLLEQSTLATQARIQQIAQNKLNMAMPKQQEAMLLRG